MIEIFHLFKRKNHIQEESINHETPQEKLQTTTVLEDAKKSLQTIEAMVPRIKDPFLFSNLISFIAYYFFILEFYTKNIEEIISVKELLFLKYIDMIQEILLHFEENIDTQEQQETLYDTLSGINEKLYATIQNIKEQQTLNLHVDLKTIQDLIQSDF
ncbi:hypothetical protein QBE52_01945 [Clostridiaceae bacterium 35-E11]